MCHNLRPPSEKLNKSLLGVIQECIFAQLETTHMYCALTSPVEQLMPPPHLSQHIVDISWGSGCVSGSIICPSCSSICHDSYACPSPGMCLLQLYTKREIAQLECQPCRLTSEHSSEIQTKILQLCRKSQSSYRNFRAKSFCTDFVPSLSYCTFSLSPYVSYLQSQKNAMGEL